MATTVGSIIVRIGADTSDLVKGVGRAETSLAKVGRTAIGIGKIIATALVAAGTAIAGMALQGVKLGNELARAARVVGLTAAELGGLHHAAALSEVSTEQLDKGLQRLGRTVSDADSGLKSATRTLQELGLDANELEKLPLSEQFLKVTDAMKGMTSQGDKLRIATQLFGKAGAELIPLLDESSDAIRGMMEESKQLGLQLDQTQSRVVQEASDSLDRMKGSFTGLAMQLGATFGPAIEAAAEAIAKITAAVTNALPHLSALAARILGVTRRLEDLSSAQAVAESQMNFAELIELQEKLQRLQEANPQGRGGAGVEDVINENLARQAELRARNLALLNEIIARKKEEATLIPATGGGDDGDDLDAAQKAAEAELKLITDVAEERERVGALEVAQEFEWSNILSEERERFYALELQQLFDWNTVLAEERERFSAEEIDAMWQKEGLLTQAHREGVEARVAFSKMEAGLQVKTVLGSLAAMTAGIAQHSKRAFEMNKLAAIGNAIINTAEGMTKALAQGGFFGIAMAAAVGAAGYAQIRAIKSTSFQGGGAGTTPSAAATPVVNSQPVPQGAGSDRTIRLEGIKPGLMYSGRELLERLNEAISDGGKLVIAGA